MTQLFTVLFTGLGLVFFAAGTLGLLRFTDSHSRLHALTKADNLGLGLVIVGVALQADSWTVGIKLLAIWILALLAAATVAQLIARAALPADARKQIRSLHDP